MAVLVGKRHTNKSSSKDQGALYAQALDARAWAIDHALPFWAGNARDDKGGFYEELSHNYAPNKAAIRRLRVQARQIYTYSFAHELGWYDGLKTADKTLNFMLEKGFMPDDKRGFIHLLGPDYSVVDARRDLYDHAFYLLALAWHARVSGRRSSLALADSLLAFLDNALGADNGGYLEGLPLDDPRNALRRQNPHMHLLEAFMALYDASGDDKYLARAGRIVTLFKKHFFNRDTGTVTEFFHRGWTPAHGAKGKTVEPGHAAEWIWLLGQYEARTQVDTRRYANALYENLLQIPGLYLSDELDRDGKTRRATKRLWVQTELVKAHISQADFGNIDAADKAADTLQGILRDYLKPNGTWTDTLGENGLPIFGPIPTSTFYHILCMIAESCRSANIQPLREPRYARS